MPGERHKCTLRNKDQGQYASTACLSLKTGMESLVNSLNRGLLRGSLKRIMGTTQLALTGRCSDVAFETALH